MFKEIGVGIASKDGSSVKVLEQRCKITNCGAMTYRKKSFCSPRNVCVLLNGNGDKYFREIGSQLVVDQSLIAEKVLDVRVYTTQKLCPNDSGKTIRTEISI